MEFIGLMFTIMISLLCICLVGMCFENMYNDVDYSY